MRPIFFPGSQDPGQEVLKVEEKFDAVRREDLRHAEKAEGQAESRPDQKRQPQARSLYGFMGLFSHLCLRHLMI